MVTIPDPIFQRLDSIATVFDCLDVSFTCFVLQLSMLAIIYVPKGMPEDVFLVAALSCYTLPPDCAQYKGGHCTIVEEACSASSYQSAPNQLSISYQSQ